MLSFPLPCLLQSCWDVCRPAWAGSGASAGHGIGWKMHYHMRCAQLLDVGCWVQSWGDCMLPWQGVGRGSHTAPGGMSCSSGWVVVPAAGIHGEGALPYWEELQVWDLSCQQGCGAACVALSPVPHSLLPMSGLVSCRTSTRSAVGSMAWPPPPLPLLPPPPALSVGPGNTSHSSARLRPRAQLKIKTNHAAAEIQCLLPSCPPRGWRVWGRGPRVLAEMLKGMLLSAGDREWLGRA